MLDQESFNVAKREIISGQRLLAFITILLTPLALSIWVEKADPTTVGPWTFWAVVLAIACVQIWTFFRLSVGASDTAPALLMKCLEQEQERQEFIQQEWSREREISALVSSIALSKSWAAFQAHLVVYFKNPGADLQAVCGRIVSPLMSSADEIFGFEAKDRWSVAVYRWNEATELLEPIYWERERDHPSTGNPRSWRDGEGDVLP